MWRSLSNTGKIRSSILARRRIQFSPLFPHPASPRCSAGMVEYNGFPLKNWALVSRAKTGDNHWQNELVVIGHLQRNCPVGGARAPTPPSAPPSGNRKRYRPPVILRKSTAAAEGHCQRRSPAPASGRKCPGAPEEKQSSVVTTRVIKMNEKQ